MRICETFRSLQGEGLTMGAVTFFIRTVGCNLSCEWCDTPYSKEGGHDMTVGEIMRLAKNERNVCITGGEPLLQSDIYELLDALLADGKSTVVETNGSMDISKIPVSDNVVISMDVKCPSSGMSNKTMLSNVKHLKRTDQMKFVISDPEDLEFASSFLRSNDIKCNVIFTPVGGTDLKELASAVIEKGMNVRVLPQLHKLIWGEERGK